MFYSFCVDWFDLNGKSWRVIKNAVIAIDEKRREFGFTRPWVVCTIINIGYFFTPLSYKRHY